MREFPAKEQSRHFMTIITIVDSIPGHIFRDDSALASLPISTGRRRYAGLPL
jgi:hypothetical protein